MDFNYTTGVDSNISRLTSISDASGTLEAYSYQGDGTVLERNHTQPGLNLTTTLDDFGRIIDFNWTNSGGSVSHYAYGYDPAGNRLYKEDLVNTGLSELYTYDGLSQLATSARGTLNSSKNAITGTPDFEQSWNHDALGNWDDVTTNGIIDDRDSNAQNEYTDVDGNIPAYDANGNMTTDQTGKHFVWDAWNRLVEVQDSSSTTLRTHTYDSLNRRVTSDDGTTVTTLYYSTGWQVLQEQVAGDVTKQYVYSPFYPDALILRDRDTDADGVLDERLWVIQDNNFNVLALVDATGTVVERYKYTAFGVATVMDASYTVQSTSAYAWVHLHQGLRFEEASGLYDNRFRWYSAELGQFVSNDPIGFDAGDVNVRRYVGNGAVGAVDPLGLVDWGPIGGVYRNDGDQDEWVLIKNGIWEKVPSGKSTSVKEDCDGATSNGRFYKIRNTQTLMGSRKGPPYVFGGVQISPLQFEKIEGGWTPSDGNPRNDPAVITGGDAGTIFPPGLYKWADGTCSKDGKKIAP